MSDTASDEQAIRDLIAEWMKATMAGDVSSILPLMDEDIVFLTPGGVMRGRDAFAKNLQDAQSTMKIEPRSEIQEITILGDHAYCWNKLTVLMFPPEGGVPKQFSGNALSIFRKRDGKWLLIRDSNTVVPAT